MPLTPLEALPRFANNLHHPSGSMDLSDDDEARTKSPHQSRELHCSRWRTQNTKATKPGSRGPLHRGCGLVPQR